MKAVEVAIDEWSGPVVLVLLGDLHIGNAGADEGLIETVAKRLSGENVYWVDLGDAIDAVNMRDPRFDPRSLPEWISIADLIDLPKAQVARYRHFFGRLGETCLARLYGNHEFALQRHTERDVYAELNRAIGLPEERALGYSGFVRLRFRHVSGRKRKVSDTWTQTVFLHHGHGGGRLAGAKALKLERMVLLADADIYAMGHTHTKLVLQRRRHAVSPRTTEIVDQHQIMVNVGAFMDGRDGYVERGMFYPQEEGPVELWFYPDRKEIRIVQ